MTQNTEQNVRTREEQIDALASQFGEEGTFTFVDDGDAATKHILEAEARGATEQRRKDVEGSLRPMSEAKKDRTPILAKIHDDLFPRVYPERKDLKPWNGRWVVISHTGILADGFDIGWGVAAPVGCGGLTDDWFVGWKPVECTANVAALEAEITKLRAENDHQRTQLLELRNDDRRIRLAAERVCSERNQSEIFLARIALRATLTREGGV